MKIAIIISALLILGLKSNAQYPKLGLALTDTSTIENDNSIPKLKFQLDSNNNLCFCNKTILPAYTDKQLVFNKAKSFISDLEASSSGKMISASLENGTIEGKGTFIVYRYIAGVPSYAGVVNYNIQFLFSSNYLEYRITDLVHDKTYAKIGSGGKINNKIPECGFNEIDSIQWKYIQEQSILEANSIKNKIEKNIISGQQMSIKTLTLPALQLNLNQSSTEFQKAANNFIAAPLFGLAASVMVFYGPKFINTGSVQDDIKTTLVIGGGLYLVSFSCSLAGGIHLGKAAKQLNVR